MRVGVQLRAMEFLELVEDSGGRGLERQPSTGQPLPTKLNSKRGR